MTLRDVQVLCLFFSHYEKSHLTKPAIITSSATFLFPVRNVGYRLVWSLYALYFFFIAYIKLWRKLNKRNQPHVGVRENRAIKKAVIVRK